MIYKFCFISAKVNYIFYFVADYDEKSCLSENNYKFGLLYQVRQISIYYKIEIKSIYYIIMLYRRMFKSSINKDYKNCVVQIYHHLFFFIAKYSFLWFTSTDFNFLVRLRIHFS